MAERPQQPGEGQAPGIEDQTLQTATGKPAQVPAEPGAPNQDAFDRSAEADALRPEVDAGPGDPRSGAGDLPAASDNVDRTE